MNDYGEKDRKTTFIGVDGKSHILRSIITVIKGIHQLLLLANEILSIRDCIFYILEMGPEILT